MSDTDPKYPAQGEKIVHDSLRSLLPRGYYAKDGVLLFVHAHPDDETSSTGATMAAYAREGAKVYLLTLTRGEMGEVIPDELKHLEVGAPGNKDNGEALGEYRTGELAAAVKKLGITDSFFLGQEPATAPGAAKTYRDSGMVWGKDGKPEPNPKASEDSLTNTDIEPQSQAIANAIRAIKPDALITYDTDGGYGHPDHVRTHQAVAGALKILKNDSAKPILTWCIEGQVDPEDKRVQAAIYGSGIAKTEAMRQHKTQIRVTGGETFEYSNGVPQKISAIETYRLFDGSPDGSVQRKPQPSSMIATVIMSLIIGFIAGLAGSVYHAWVYYTGDTVDTAVPVGLVLGYITVFCASVWAATLSRRVLGAPVVAAAVLFTVCMLAFARPDSPFILANTDPNIGPIGTIGVWWLSGASLVALAATPLVIWWLHKDEQHYTARAAHQRKRKRRG